MGETQSSRVRLVYFSPGTDIAIVTAAVDVGKSKRGIELNRLSVISDGLIEVAFAVVGKAAVDVGTKKLGVKLNRLGIISDGSIKVTVVGVNNSFHESLLGRTDAWRDR